MKIDVYMCALVGLFTIVVIFGFVGAGPNFGYVSPSSSLAYFNNSNVYLNLSLSDSSNDIYSFFSDGLVGWWRFNNDSAIGDNATFFRDESPLGNNGTCVAANCPDLISGGRFGGGGYFNVSQSDYVTLNRNYNLSSTNAFTVNVWVKLAYQTNAYYAVIEQTSSSSFNEFDWVIYQQANNWIGFNVKNGTSGTVGSYAVGDYWLNQNVWMMFTGVFNGTTVLFYRNGSLLGTKQFNGTARYSSSSVIRIGRMSGSSYINGSVDDIAIFNRSLSQSEISALYNSSFYSLQRNLSGLTDAKYNYTAKAVNSSGVLNSTFVAFYVDTAVPSSINLNSPSNASYFNSSSINFNWTVIDATSPTMLCNITLDGVVNGSNLSSQNNSIVNFTIQGLSEGQHSYNLTCLDGSGNRNVSVTNLFYVDLTYPQIYFSDPTPENNSAKMRLFANVSIVDTNLANITYYWGNNFTVYNLSGSNITVAIAEVSNVSVINLGAGVWRFSLYQEGFIVGQSYNYRVSTSDYAGNSNSTSLRTVRANAAPGVVNITYDPSDANSIDPNVNITFISNVSDVDGNFESAILQWKNDSGEWNNITMTNLSSKAETYILLNATLQMPTYMANLTYRVWVSDTESQVGSSSNSTFESRWDCTWVSTGDLSAVAGWNENKFVGNITINNTGDPEFGNNNCTITFRVNHNLVSGRIYFDGNSLKPSNSFSVSAESSRNIIVNASFLGEVRQESVTITENDVSGVSGTGISEVTERNTSLTVVSNQNGPYLYEAVVSNPSVVYLTLEDFNIKTYLRNLMGSAIINENNTAYNVSFYLKLPSGIINISGESNISYANITNNGYNYIDTNLSFSNLEGISPGVKTFELGAYGYNISGNLITDTNGNNLSLQSFNISFLCYSGKDGISVSACGSLDGDYVAPSSSSTTSNSGGGGGGGVSSGTKYEKSEATFELVRGRDSEFSFEFKNKYVWPMRDISISVSGLKAEYIIVNQKVIGLLNPGESTNISMKISAPSYFPQGKYTIYFDISGYLVTNSSLSNVGEKKVTTLYVLEIPKEEANLYLDNMGRWFEEMNNSGMNVKVFGNLFEQAKGYFNDSDFTNLKKIYEVMQTMHQSAIDSESMLKDLKLGVEEARARGIDVLQTEKLLYLAETAFQRGDYSLALERLKEAKLTYALEVKGEFNLVYEIKNNPIQSTGVVFALFAFTAGSTLFIRLRLYKNKLRMLEEEEKLILELMKLIQKECFEKMRMSMEEYNEAMKQYEIKLSETIEDKIRVQTKIANLLKVKGKRRALDEEKQRMILLIKETQKDYLQKGNIETRIYENMIKTYSTRLTEVEEQLTFMDAQDRLSSTNRIKSLFRFRRRNVH